MFAARPIVTTANEGPVRGTLIFGRFLTEARVAALSELVHVDVHIHDITDPLLPANLHPAQMTPSADSDLFTQAQGHESFTGYAAVYDIYGQPADVISVEIPRNIYRQGISSLYYLFAAIGLVTLLFTAMIFLLMERTILTRMSKMGDVIRQIRSTNDIALRVPIRETTRSRTWAVDSMICLKRWGRRNMPWKTRAMNSNLGW